MSIKETKDAYIIFKQEKPTYISGYMNIDFNKNPFSDLGFAVETLYGIVENLESIINETNIENAKEKASRQIVALKELWNRTHAKLLLILITLLETGIKLNSFGHIKHFLDAFSTVVLGESIKSR